MVEVFKTDVSSEQHASLLLDRIHWMCAGHSANFDLDDCDKILRVECNAGPVNTDLIITILKDQNCRASVLPDNVEYFAHQNV
jgi:hypothetical protein